MKASRLHPELRAYRFFPNPPVGNPWFVRVSRKLIGMTPDPSSIDGVAIERVSLAPGVRLRVYEPGDRTTGGALLWMHGGGMVVGSAAQDDGHCADVAAKLGILVVSVDYRLAPEHPFPHAVDDSRRAWQWMLSEGPRIDTAKIVIGGQSAGGCLAASLAQRLHDEGGVQPIGQWLFCPMLDDRTAADRSLDAGRHFLWHNRSNLAGWTAYLGTAPGADALPDYAAPARRRELAGLPPAWIGIGDIDLFYEENRAYAAALTAAGVECELDVVAGGPHGFERFQPKAPVSQAYLERAYAWLRRRLVT